MCYADGNGTSFRWLEGFRGCSAAAEKPLIIWLQVLSEISMHFAGSFMGMYRMHAGSVLMQALFRSCIGTVDFPYVCW